MTVTLGSHRECGVKCPKDKRLANQPPRLFSGCAPPDCSSMRLSWRAVTSLIMQSPRSTARRVREGSRRQRPGAPRQLEHREACGAHERHHAHQPVRWQHPRRHYPRQGDHRRGGLIHPRITVRTCTCSTSSPPRRPDVMLHSPSPGLRRAPSRAAPRSDHWLRRWRCAGPPRRSAR